MGSKVGKILKTVAPLAASYFAPGIGAAIGPGLSTAGQAALGGAVAGGLTGAATGGGLSGALKGAALGGVGGYALNGGFGDIGGGISDALGLNGTSVGNFLTGNQNIGYTPGEITSGPIGSTGAIAASGGGGGSSFGLANILSAGLGTSANDDAEKKLLEAQQKALGAITPFQNTQFTGEDLASDPGYQFQLAEGEKALSRNQAARGNYFSGAALKAAQDYGQGLAATTFDAANSRFNNNRNFNYGVAQDQAGIYGNQGNIAANSGINNSNLLSSALSGILGGNGINNTGQPIAKTPIGYDPRTGQPIYG